MSDFLNHAGARPSQHELLLRERDEASRILHMAIATSEIEDLRKERDDARAEADRLRGELGRLAKERDDLAEKLKAGAARDRACVSRRAGPADAEIREGLEAIAKLIDAPAIGFVPGNVAHRLARVALIVGRLIAAAR